MKKGKSKSRPARRDFLKSNAAANARHKAQQATRERATYDRQKYDGSDASEES